MATTRPGFKQSQFSISWKWNFFGGPYESSIQGLHFVVAVRLEANYKNPGRFAAAHFLLLIASIAAFILSGSNFYLRAICNIV